MKTSYETDQVPWAQNEVRLKSASDRKHTYIEKIFSTYYNPLNSNQVLEVVTNNPRSSLIIYLSTKTLVKVNQIIVVRSAIMLTFFSMYSNSNLITNCWITLYSLTTLTNNLSQDFKSFDRSSKSKKWRQINDFYMERSPEISSSDRDLGKMWKTPWLVSVITWYMLSPLRFTKENSANQNLGQVDWDLG